MIQITLLTLLFSIATVISITIIGSRELISGEIGLTRIIKIIFDWRFLLGAFFAFLSRIIFLLINNALYKIPNLAIASTTLTVFITSVATIFVILSNWYFLGEKLNAYQIIGGIIIMVGIFLTTIK